MRLAIPSLFVVGCCSSSGAFLAPQPNALHRAHNAAAGTVKPLVLQAAPAKKVHILSTEADVTAAVHQIVESAAKEAIASRGHFALAIPGGSVLKVLSTLDPDSDWVENSTLAFVNHKCVSIDDVSSAIEAQAREKFLDRWGLTDIISLGGTSDGVKESSDYESKLRGLPESKLPRDGDGFPVFDLALVGVGDDGHIGSLYPNRSEIDVDDGPWTVAAFMKEPPSISLTLPVMQRAKSTVISAAGKSAKYPNGKASAMRLAVADEDVTPKDFPASALREHAVWIFDAPNGSEMDLEPSTIESAVADAC